MNRTIRRLLFVALALVGGAGIAWGLHNDHWGQTVSNATMICLSCIGIQ
jgi:hypothetical protein